MIENPRDNPLDSPDQSHLSQAQCDSLFSSWRVEASEGPDTSLEIKISGLTTLFERSFGPTPAIPWASETQRAQMLALFLCAIKPELFEHALAERTSSPLIETFFERIDSELRNVISKLDENKLGGLFGSGYPLGSGTDSLAHLGITHELSQRGPTGVLTLLCRCGGQPYAAKQPWVADLIRAANIALSEATSQGVRNYLVGLRQLLPPDSPCAPQAHDLFAGMSTKVPIERLVEIYSRARHNNRIALSVREALLVQIIDALTAISGAPLRQESVKPQKTSDLPVITQDTVKLAKDIRELIERTTEKTKALRQLVGGNKPETGDLKKEEIAPPSADTQKPRKHSGKTPQGMGLALSTLNGKRLTSFLKQKMGEGLLDPSSELSRAFVGQLKRVPIRQLLLIRKTLVSFADVPAVHVSAVDARINKYLTEDLSQLGAEKLLSAYALFSDPSVRRDEFKLVIKALRERLQLPRRDEDTESQALTDSGLRVWRWFFAKGPPDGTILSDFVKTHFDKLVAKAVHEIRRGPVRHLPLDALLAYAKELNLLSSYKPNADLIHGDTWKVLVFAVRLRREVEDKDSVTTFFIDLVSNQVMTRELAWWDAFSKDWATHFDPASIHTITSEICEKLRCRLPETTRDEMALLINNLHLMGRRGPSAFQQLSKLAQKRFIEVLLQLTPQEGREIDQNALRILVAGMSAAGYRALAILRLLEDECVRRASLLSPSEFADIAVAFANLRAGTPTFWSKFTESVERDWDGYNEQSILGRLWGIIVMAPELLPERFDVSVLERCSKPSFQIKVYQTLIALGRYTPEPHDRAYTRVLQRSAPHRQLPHEKILESELPTIIGMPPESVFSQVVVGGCETDFIVDFGHRRLIIELDGEHHFLSGPDGGILNGKDEFQDRVFKWLGYQVFHFPTTALTDSTERQRFCSELAALAQSLKEESTFPGRARRVYLEDLSRARDETALG